MKTSFNSSKTSSLFVAVLFSLFTLSLTAQNTQKGFSFQGFARDFDGAAYSSSNITAKFSVYPNGESTVEYTEEQSLSTDAYGVFNAIIGSEAPVDFSELDFSAKNYNMKVEVRVTGGDYVTISDSELLAVPYAKAADRATNATNAENATSADNGTPAGTVISFAGATAPTGYLVCDGQEVSKASYPELYAAIGDLWGTPQSGTNFKLPDLRGQFLRGQDDGAGVDPDVAGRTDIDGNIVGDVIGSYQEDMYENHTHTINYQPTRSYGWNSGDHVMTNNDWQFGQFAQKGTNGAGGSETRSKNAYVLYVIKY